jgi:hypothetical protein
MVMVYGASMVVSSRSGRPFAEALPMQLCGGMGVRPRCWLSCTIGDGVPGREGSFIR